MRRGAGGAGAAPRRAPRPMRRRHRAGPDAERGPFGKAQAAGGEQALRAARRRRRRLAAPGPLALRPGRRSQLCRRDLDGRDARPERQARGGARPGADLDRRAHGRAHAGDQPHRPPARHAARLAARRGRQPALRPRLGRGRAAPRQPDRRAQLRARGAGAPRAPRGACVHERRAEATWTRRRVRRGARHRHRRHGGIRHQLGPRRGDPGRSARGRHAGRGWRIRRRAGAGAALGWRSISSPPRYAEAAAGRAIRRRSSPKRSSERIFSRILFSSEAKTGRSSIPCAASPRKLGFR